MKSNSWVRIFFLSLVTIPILYGIKRNSGTFLIPFEQSLGITRADSSLLISLWLIVWAVSFLIFGLLNRIIRLNALLLVGMLISALGFLMTSFARTYVDLLIWFSIVSGLGLGGPWLAAYGTAIHETKSRGFSTGLIQAMQLAGAAFLFVGLSWLIERAVGLSGTFVALAFLLALGGVIGYFLASERKSGFGSLKFDLKLIRFYIAVPIMMGAWYLWMIHRLPLFKELGIDLKSLGILALISLVVNTATEPLAGWWFIDRLKRSRLAWKVASLTLSCAYLALIFLGRGYISFTAYAFLWGILLLAPSTVVASVNYLADFHREDWAPIMGSVLFLSNLSQAFFVWLAGALYVWLGNYDLVLMAMSIIVGICAFALKR